MSHLKFNPRTTILLLLILIVTLFRLLVTFNTDILSFANFSSVGAVALFSGAYFKNNLKALAFPLLSLLISDIVLSNTLYKSLGDGFLYSGWYWVYGAFALMVMVGKLLLNKIHALNFVLASLIVVLIHWVVTDIGVWYQNPLYTQNLQGFWQCLVKAIPFEKSFLYGTLIYGVILFCAFEMLKVKYPALNKQTTLAL